MDFAATMVSPHRQFMINLRTTIWAQALHPQELARVEAEISERAVPAGGYVCRKGEPVNHWIPQRVNQALQALEKLGLLRVEYGGVTILDLEGLRNHGT
jgi:hypothetical protein